jgi:hypothetical protein
LTKCWRRAPPVLEQAVELAKQRTLHGCVLEDSLDDDVAAGERIDVRRPFESLEQGTDGARLELAALDGAWTDASTCPRER